MACSGSMPICCASCGDGDMANNRRWVAGCRRWEEGNGRPGMRKGSSEKAQGGSSARSEKQGVGPGIAPEHLAPSALKDVSVAVQRAACKVLLRPRTDPRFSSSLVPPSRDGAMESWCDQVVLPACDAGGCCREKPSQTIMECLANDQR